jgi:hypothetical protein
MLRNVNCPCLQKEQEDSKKLKDLRDLAVYAFFMLNAFFVVVIYLMQLSRDQLYIRWPLGVTANITVDSTNEVRIFSVYTKLYIYRVSQEECKKLRESVPCVKLYRYNPKHLYQKLNGYGDNGHRKVWSSLRFHALYLVRDVR